MGRRRTIFSFLLGFLIAIPSLLLLSAFVFWFILDFPYGKSDGKTQEFIVEKGDTISSTARRLADAEFIDNTSYIVWRYKILIRFSSLPPLQAGHFALSMGLRPSQIITMLTDPGAIHRVYQQLTVPPGLTSSKIALLVENLGLARSEDFLQSLISLAPEYPIKQTETGLQGYLFPDTYHIDASLGKEEGSSQAVAEMIIRMMVNRLWSILDKIDPSWRSITRSQLHEKIILASIVEREYRVASEARMIAAVFNNRLKNGMRLESCATVVYAIEETEEGFPYRRDYHRFQRRIFEQYLEIPSFYNTYTNNALPPAPIAIAGYDALDAAFFPALSEVLFFVVQDAQLGTHKFSQNYNDHLKARENYLNKYVVKD